MCANGYAPASLSAAEIPVCEQPETLQVPVPSGTPTGCRSYSSGGDAVLRLGLGSGRSIHHDATRFAEFCRVLHGFKSGQHTRMFFRTGGEYCAQQQQTICGYVCHWTMWERTLAPDQHFGRAAIPPVCLHNRRAVLTPVLLVDHSTHASFECRMEGHLMRRPGEWSPWE